MSELDFFKLLFDPGYRRDPHPHLKQLREADPVHRSPTTGMWFLTRHADCVKAVRSPKLGRDMTLWNHPQNTFRPENAHLDPEMAAFNASIYNQMFHRNPPEHTRQRAVFQHAFVPRAIAKMEEVVEATAERLSQEMATGELDLIESFAARLPVEVICGIFEVPLEDSPRLRAWSDAVAQTVELTITPEQKKAAVVAKREFDAYLEALVEQRREKPGDGLIDHVIAAEAVEGKLSHQELINNLASMLVAGHETTTNLIGNGLLTLLQHPEQYERLRSDPELAATAVEEMLRYEPPASTNARVTIEDVELGGKEIPRGSLCIALISGANRDPEAFEQPESFDIGRDPNPHQTFGGGPHHCIGVSLARLEARIALEALMRRFSNMELAGEPVWQDRINIRGLSSLPLRVEA